MTLPSWYGEKHTPDLPDWRAVAAERWPTAEEVKAELRKPTTGPPKQRRATVWSW